MGPQQQCKVCNEAKSKYKCPACLVPYCSLACFKKHKETPCATPKPVLPDEEPKTLCATPVSADEKPKTSATTVSVDEKPTTSQMYAGRPLFVDEQCEVLDQAKLETIGSSTEIRDALKSEHLRKLICNIDNSPNALEELENAMGVDAFRIFSDKVLSAVDL